MNDIWLFQTVSLRDCLALVNKCWKENIFVQKSCFYLRCSHMTLCTNLHEYHSYHFDFNKATWYSKQFVQLRVHMYPTCLCIYHSQNHIVLHFACILHLLPLTALYLHLAPDARKPSQICTSSYFTLKSKTMLVTDGFWVMSMSLWSNLSIITVNHHQIKPGQSPVNEQKMQLSEDNVIWGLCL